MSEQLRERVVIIAGTPPGGGQDRAARAISRALQLPVPIEVVNLSGRGGGDGWEELARSPGKAEVVSISSPTLITNRILGMAALAHADLTALALLCTEYLVWVVAAGSVISDARQLPGRLPELTMALATARGNVNHIACGWLAREAGWDPSRLQIRVFPSAPEAVSVVLKGEVEVAAVSAASVTHDLKDLRVLATSAPTRLPAPFTEVPTWRELGVDCEIGTWRGVVGPPDLNPSQVDFWAGAIATAVQAVSWHEDLRRHFWQQSYLDPAATAAFHQQQTVVLGDALAGLGLKADG